MSSTPITISEILHGYAVARTVQKYVILTSLIVTGTGPQFRSWLSDYTFV